MGEWWEERNLAQKILLGIGFGILGIGLLALFGWVVMLLWNWLMPDLFGLKRLDYWQAWGLLALCTILFKGFGSGAAATAAIGSASGTCAATCGRRSPRKRRPDGRWGPAGPSSRRLLVAVEPCRNYTSFRPAQAEMDEASLRQEIEATLEKYIRNNYLPRNAGANLSIDENLFDSGILDSAGLISFITYLEKSFGLAIPDEDLLPENFFRWNP